MSNASSRIIAKFVDLHRQVIKGLFVASRCYSTEIEKQEKMKMYEEMLVRN